MQKMVDVIDCFSEYVGRALAWLLPAMVIMMAVVVVMRYGFDIGLIGVQELVIYSHAVIFLFGIGYALKHDEHVRVDVFYRNFSQRNKALVNLFGTLFLLMPVAAFILYASLDFVSISWKMKESSTEPGGLPFVYLLKTALPVAAGLILLQGISEVLKAILTLQGKPQAEPKHGDIL